MHLRTKLKITFFKSIIGLLTVLMFFPLRSQSSTTNYDLYQLKAAMLFIMIKYHSWPSEALSKHTYFTVGVLGTNPFGKNLDSAILGKNLHKKPLRIVYGKDVKELSNCLAIVICKSEESKIKSIIEQITNFKNNPSVLTIGDEINDFCKLGGMVNFSRQQGSISPTYEINPKALNNARIIIDSQLLQMAKNIIPTAN